MLYLVVHGNSAALLRQVSDLQIADQSNVINRSNLRTSTYTPFLCNLVARERGFTLYSLHHDIVGHCALDCHSKLSFHLDIVGDAQDVPLNPLTAHRSHTRSIDASMTGNTQRH